MPEKLIVEAAPLLLFLPSRTWKNLACRIYKPLRGVLEGRPGNALGWCLFDADPIPAPMRKASASGDRPLRRTPCPAGETTQHCSSAASRLWKTEIGVIAIIGAKPLVDALRA